MAFLYHNSPKRLRILAIGVSPASFYTPLSKMFCDFSVSPVVMKKVDYTPQFINVQSMCILQEFIPPLIHFV